MGYYSDVALCLTKNCMGQLKAALAEYGWVRTLIEEET